MHIIFFKSVLTYLRICVSLADYGNVVELRINSGGKLPNFGFVVFDDSEPVQKVLSNRVSNFYLGFFFFFYNLNVFIHS